MITNGKKPYILVAVIALLHLLITFFTDQRVFLVPVTDNLPDYILCKVLAYAVLYAFYYGLFLLFFDKTAKGEAFRELLKCAMPYLVVIIVIAAFKLRDGYISNDETLIYQNAVTLEHYIWFTYLTTYFYIVALMLIPHVYGPIFLKLILEFLVVGYVVYRVRGYLGRYYGCATYLLFLLYPVLAYTTSAHRLPIYFFVYLYLMTVLLFDRLEKKTADPGKIAFLVFLSAVLTQWRTEGIYLAVLSVILLLFAYPPLRQTKNLILLITGSLLCQYLISVPQNGFTASELSAKADDRMKPFYAYTVTNMFRNGLDREKNREELAVIDRYLSLDVIDAINDYYGDINYEDSLILYADGFVGVREEASVADFFDYADACKRLFKNNPEVLLKTRFGAFCYAALPYHISFTGKSPAELASFGLSVVKTVSYNLFIPVCFILLLCIYALIRRRFYTFFLTGGLLCHFLIVFVLAPASYFKYYYPVYIMAYFYILLLILQLVYNKKHSEKISFII